MEKKQKKKRPIEFTIQKGNSFAKRINSYFKRRNPIRNEEEFNTLKNLVEKQEEKK